MAVYLIHFEERYHHAGHYLGASGDVVARIQAHRAGRGARLMEVVREAGIPWRVVRVWPEGGYELERALKSQHNGPRLCPLCNPRLGLVAREELEDGAAGVQAELQHADGFLIWLARWREGEVGWSDEIGNCPLGNWLAAVYGGEWQVSAGTYRWRVSVGDGWGEWCKLPPWAIVFVDGLFRQFGNGPVTGEQASVLLGQSLVELECWQGSREDR